jgi:cold shock CspA family protein
MSELTGEVVVFDNQKRFGFISFEQNGRECRTFFLGSRCAPDEIGRMADVWVPGTLVRFRIKQTEHRGKTSIMATDVCPAFREEYVGDPAEHREISRVIRWLNPGRNGFLRRESGEDIWFCVQQAAPGHAERFETLVEGQRVFHGICVKVRNGISEVEAVEIEVFSASENAQLERADREPAIEQATEPQASPPEPELVSVCASETRQLSLIEIVRRNRNGNSRQTKNCS